MEKTTFLLLLIVYFISYSMKNSILTKFHRKEELLWLSQKALTYIFVSIFVILMIVGVLFTKNNDYSNVSKGFEKVRNPVDKNRPEKYFDIDTYPDKEY
jgi:hypothetical protein